MVSSDHHVRGTPHLLVGPHLDSRRTRWLNPYTDLFLKGALSRDDIASLGIIVTEDIANANAIVFQGPPECVAGARHCESKWHGALRTT